MRPLVWLTLLGCGETAVSPLDTDTRSPPDTDNRPDSDTDPSDSDPGPERCEPVAMPRGPVAEPVECQGSTPLSEPVLEWEWRFPDGELHPGGAVLVAPWVDSNADGLVDDVDTPHVFVPVFADGRLSTVVLEGSTGRAVKSLPMQLGALASLIGHDGPEAWGMDPDSVPKRLMACDPLGCREWTLPEPFGRWDAWRSAVVDGEQDGLPEFYDASGTQFQPDTASLALSPWSGGLTRAAAAAVVQDLFSEGRSHQVFHEAILAPDGTPRCTFVDVGPFPRVGLGLGGVVKLVGVAHLTVATPCGPVEYEHPEDFATRVPRDGAVADFDGDGEAELGQPVLSRGGRPSGVRVLNLDGTLVWERYDLPNRWGNSETTAADLDGDGDFEVLGPGPQIYDGRTGEIVLRFDPPEVPEDISDLALIAVDLDLDGHMEVIVPDLNRVRVYSGKEGWADGPTIWNQWSFTGTNIYPDGTVPRDPIEPWEMHNTFRASAGQAELRGKGSDLVARFVEVCEKECDRDRARIAVQLGNAGTAAILRPVVMELFGVRGGERDLLATWTYPGVEAATWLAGEDVQVDVTTPFDDLQVEVRSTGWRHQQCDAGNDVVAWGRAVCR